MTKDKQTLSLAVLIDADNANARYARAIFDEIVKLGEANVPASTGISQARICPHGMTPSNLWRSCNTSSATTPPARTPPTSRW